MNRKMLYIIFIIFGFALIVGTVGAYEVGNIGTAHAIIQGLVGVALCLPYTFKYGRD